MKILALFSLVLLLGCSTLKKEQHVRGLASGNENADEEFREYCLNFPIMLSDTSELPVREQAPTSRTYRIENGDVLCEFRNYRVSEIITLRLDEGFRGLCPFSRFKGGNQADHEAISNSNLSSTQYTGAVLTSGRLYCSGGAPM